MHRLAVWCGASAGHEESILDRYVSVLSLCWLFLRLLCICTLATPTAASSPSKVFHAALSKASTFRLLVAYTFSAALLTLVHVITAIASEGSEARLSPFVKSKYV